MAGDNRSKLEQEYQERFGVAWDDKVDRANGTTRSLRLNWLRRRARELGVEDFPGAQRKAPTQVEVAPQETTAQRTPPANQSLSGRPQRPELPSEPRP